MGSLPKRDEIDKKYKWNLEDIYENVDIWEEDFKKIENSIDNIVKYKGTLQESAENFWNALN